jgi:hypothetical protein
MKGVGSIQGYMMITVISIPNDNLLANDMVLNK